MKFEKLSPANVEQYIQYYKEARNLEPEQMIAETYDEEGIRKRINDPFYMNTTSILAIEEGKVIGRIEFHFYGCMQDGYRMSYVDWVYVLPEYRHKGVAQGLFKEFEAECKKHDINQYYLIRSTEKDADKFYHSFVNASLDDEPMLRKDIK